MPMPAVIARSYKQSSFVRQLPVFGALVLSAALLPSGVRAQTTDWPSRPVTTVIGFAAGGNSDVLARLLTTRMTEQLKQPFVIEPRVGGGGVVAMRSVAQADPDGYTMFFAAAPQIGVIPNIQKLNFDPAKDLAPVSAFATGPFLLVVNADTPVSTIAEFVALAKTRKLNYGTGGAGSNSHLTTALFASRAKIEVTNIPFRGTGPAIASLIGGQIDFMFGNASDVVPNADNGRLRIIAVAAEKRMKQLPNVPTVSEIYPNTAMPSWNGVMVPAKTPKSVIDKIAAQVIEATKDPAIVEKLARLGLEPDGNTPEEFAAQIKREQPQFDAAIKAAGLKQE
jgi:tripartite-type tricarboxylate transporter receptor subunit TctC